MLVSSVCTCRTALCFVINDLTFATFFLTPPYATVGSISWSLPINDRLFSAKSAQEWAQFSISERNSGSALHDVAASLFSQNTMFVLSLSSCSSTLLTLEYRQVFGAHRHSLFSVHLLVSSIQSIVLATRVNRPDLDSELAKDAKSQGPLAGALAAALQAIPTAVETDVFLSRIVWESAWLHLLADIKCVLPCLIASIILTIDLLNRMSSSHRDSDYDFADSCMS